MFTLTLNRKEITNSKQELIEGVTVRPKNVNKIDGYCIGSLSENSTYVERLPRDNRSSVLRKKKLLEDRARELKLAQSFLKRRTRSACSPKVIGFYLPVYSSSV